VKKHIIFLSAILIVFTLVGCNSIKENEAQTLVKEYQTKLYHVNYEDTNIDPDNAIKLAEEYKQYFTDQGYSKFRANRTFLIPMTAAKNGKYSLELNKIKLKKYSEDEKSKLVYDYDLKIKLLDINGTISEITQHGQISLVNISGEWKIDNDWVNLNEVIRKNLT
jgi:hypothetical protein